MSFDYQFIGDELFQLLSDWVLEKTSQQKVIATDLARLYAIRNKLNEGYECVIWLDADFYIFAPENFLLPETQYAVGRELWIQQDSRGRLKTYRKVHNAFLLFRENNPFLDFYCNTAEKLLQQNTGQMPPQFIGPKLLTALHNICHLPVMETAGMLSPLVLQDIKNGSGKALDRFIAQSTVPIAAANLCSSLTEAHQLHRAEIFQIMDTLDQKSMQVL